MLHRITLYYCRFLCRIRKYFTDLLYLLTFSTSLCDLALSHGYHSRCSAVDNSSHNHLSPPASTSTLPHVFVEIHEEPLFDRPCDPWCHFRLTGLNCRTRYVISVSALTLRPPSLISPPIYVTTREGGECVRVGRDAPDRDRHCDVAALRCSSSTPSPLRRHQVGGPWLEPAVVVVATVVAE